MSDAIARDLGRKIGDQLEEVLKRELAIAHIMLPTTDFAIMVLKIASSMSISSALVVVQLAKPDADREGLFDLTIEQLHNLNRRAKDRGFALLAEADAKLGRKS